MDIPLWDPKHPEGGVLLDSRQDLIKKLNDAGARLRKLNPEDLWASLEGYDVIHDNHLERCQNQQTNALRVQELVKYLKRDVVWRFHAFMKALADDTHTRRYVDEVLGEGASKTYIDHPQANAGEQTNDEPDGAAGASGGESSSSEESRGLQFLDSQDYTWIEKRFKKLQSLGGRAGQPVKVAVLDSMVNRKRLPKVSVVNCGHTLPSKYVKDRHGTNCAGIIQKCAPEVDIVNYNVAEYDKKKKQWSLNTSYIIEALKQIEKSEDIDIVSMSYGAPGRDEEEARILERLSTKKILVAAASNEGWRKANTIGYPAKLEYVIAVGSCDEYGKEAAHSSVGEELDFLMPGLEIIVAKIMKESGSGTSYAGPHLVAAAALILKAIESTQDSGLETRRRLTTTEDMRNLLKLACAGYGDHTIHRGHGLPDLDLVNKKFLKDYIDTLQSDESD